MATALPGVMIVERDRHADARGWVSELWRRGEAEALGWPPFVQENLSASTRGVVRGLHCQRRQQQGKLVTVVDGAIYDVAVDLRPAAARRGAWIAVELTAVAGQSLWIPPGCAHGFQVTSDRAVVHYALTAAYAPDDELAIRWDDPALGIAWPIAPALVSDRDAAAPLLASVAW